jgi:hypothetical protein
VNHVASPGWKTTASGHVRVRSRAPLLVAAIACLAACSPVPTWRGLVKIGLVLPFHGPTPNVALDTNAAVRQALIDRNQGGGLAGWRLELVSLDDQHDPSVAAERVSELARDPDVVALLAPPDGGEAEAARSHSLAFRPVASPDDAKAQLDALLNDVSAGLVAGTSPRHGLRARLADQ